MAAALAKVVFLDMDENHPYIIEQESYATCEGDFQFHVFNVETVGHNPKVCLVRYGKDSIDELGTLLNIEQGKPLLNGSLVWVIPLYVFDVSRNRDGSEKEEKIILDATKQQEVEAPYVEGTVEADFSKISDMYYLVKKIEVIQKFVLENGVLTMSKNGINLLTLDLKEYEHIFPHYCFEATGN